jgi:hypothetical protein
VTLPTLTRKAGLPFAGFELGVFMSVTVGKCQIWAF